MLQRSAHEQEQVNRNEATRDNETNRNAESTTSNNSEEALATHEPGAYPAKPVQDSRHDPIEETAIHYVRRTHIVKEKVNRDKQQEDNVRAAEMDFMLDLERLIKETSTGPDLIKLNSYTEDNNVSQIPNEYKTVTGKLIRSWGIIMADDRNIVPKALCYAALKAPLLRTPRNYQDV